MKKYNSFSKIKKIKALRSTQKEVFGAEIIKEPYKNIKNHRHDELLAEIHELAKRGWGDFDAKYLEKSVLGACLLVLLRNSNDKLVGMAPLKRVKIDGKTIYSFGLSVVDPDYQTLGLLKEMSKIVLKRAMIESFFRGRTSVEIIFITPNIRTMGSIARVAKFIYPNPYEIDEKTGTLPRADDETWKTIKKYLVVTKEYFRKLDREGCIMEGFYDTRSHLIVTKREHMDKKLNLFGKNYLYKTPGREVVVRAIIDLGALVKNGY